MDQSRITTSIDVVSVQLKLDFVQKRFAQEILCGLFIYTSLLVRFGDRNVTKELLTRKNPTPTNILGGRGGPSRTRNLLLLMDFSFFGVE
jgi:hypothetical protein